MECQMQQQGYMGSYCWLGVAILDRHGIAKLLNLQYTSIHDNDDKMVITSNHLIEVMLPLPPCINEELAFAVTFCLTGHYAVSDMSTTAPFIVLQAPVINVKPNIMKSTHTYSLNIPWLPTAATEAHIVPGLVHVSLISIKKLIDAGCQVNCNEDF